MRTSGKINAKRSSRTGKKSLPTSSDAEKKYKALFEQSPYGILLIDTEGKILDFNETAHRDLGYTREEFANITIADIDPVESSSDVKSRISRILEKGMAEFETRHRTKQGEIRDVHVITKALALSGRTLLHSIWRDITERKRAEGVMRLQGEIARNISEGIYLVSAKDLRIVYANPKMEDMFGYDPGEMNGQHVSIINAPTVGDPAQTASQIEKALMETGTWRGEVLNKRKDGTSFWGHASISMLHHPEHGEVYVSLQTDISEHKRAAEALRQSEDKFRTLFESAGDAIFILGMEGNFIDVNRTAYERLGYTKEEMLSMHISQVDHPDFREKISERIEHMQKYGWYQCDLAHLRKNGTVMPVEINARVMSIEGKKVIFSVIRDITERKRAEEMLRETNARLETLIQAMPDMVFLKDAEGRCVMVNRVAEECFGQNQGWFIGKTNVELMPPDTAGMCNRSDAEALRKGRAINAEEQFSDKEGRVQFLESIKAPIYNSNGTLSGLLCVARDITERKRAEEALQQSEERLRLAMSGANDGLWDWNLQTDEVHYSPRWMSMLGYDVEELEQQLDTWKRLVHPDDRERTLVAVSDLLEGRADKFEVEFRMRHKDGHYLSILSRAFVAHGTEGKVSRLVGTHVDITERKRAEEQIETSLREKEVLLKEIHHRVKNNLNVIASLLSLQSRRITEPAVVGIFEDCRNRINSMALIHEKLYQTKNLSQIDFKEYLNSLISLLSSSYIDMRDKVSVLTDIEDLSLDIDTAMTCGLITNELVTNCLKHAFPENRGGVINIRLFSEGGKRILSVRDNGIGLPDGFDLKSTNTLGLQMVKMLTRQLEGTMHVAVNNGTEIRISF